MSDKVESMIPSKRATASIAHHHSDGWVLGAHCTKVPPSLRRLCSAPNLTEHGRHKTKPPGEEVEDRHKPGGCGG